jgi:hypothetical protein
VPGFSWGTVTKFLHAFLFSHVRATCSATHSILDAVRWLDRAVPIRPNS